MDPLQRNKVKPSWHRRGFTACPLAVRQPWNDEDHEVFQWCHRFKVSQRLRVPPGVEQSASLAAVEAQPDGTEARPKSTTTGLIPPEGTRPSICR